MHAELRRLKFRPELEAAFIEDHATRSLPIIRSFFGIAGFIVLVAGLAQIPSGRPELRGFINVALGLMVPVCALICAATLTKWFVRVIQPALLLTCTVIASSILFVWDSFPGQYFPYYGPLAAALLLPIIYTISRLRFYWATACAWIIVALYFWMGTVRRPLDIYTGFQPIYVMLSNLFGMMAAYHLEFTTRRDFVLNRLLDEERLRSESVLANILPGHIATRLKDGPQVIADYYPRVSVLFADIVDFTLYASGRRPNEVVAALDEVFSEMDALAEQFRLEKIKTVGDAYMVVAGLPDQMDDDEQRIAEFAFRLHTRLSEISNHSFQMRIGIHCGPVVAGVIGKKKLVYDLWGDTVNTASRLESTGMAGQVQVSKEFAEAVADTFAARSRGEIALKGKGAVETFFLEPPEAERPTGPSARARSQP